ncbi:serine/threonine-protein phosphatase 6 regulatory subunit 3 isoform X2 [Ceratina calcarata]|uniref:Serine/threonine-protein phosphatase 6 regulatory subunit 3 isoform X2 n=1 Tax=Ceratina calcarata TaxID=156304 RepID=A0AAJ7JGH1_9HYME|nr:serine/threonine-protein phosphatase 6 regulatory subunit 3 isoform X2 [Ceratina calcarata]
MFWANNYMSSPNIEALLNKENVTLHELMDEEDILQECKGQNKKLIEYLARSDVLEELISLTTREPSTDIEERWRYRYPNIACELLTCDVPILNEKLAGNETLLAKLYSFIDTDQPLNPLLASFFSKTIGVLIGHKTVQNWYSYQFTCLQLLAFLKSRQTCVDLLLRHLETSAIMDLVLKLVSQVEGNMRQHILNWLDGQRLVQRLVKLMSPDSEASRHANASQLLCDMVTAARENRRTSTSRTGPDPILNTLESPDTVGLILETVLTGDRKVESSIIGGIQVLLTLFPKTNDESGMNEGNSVQNGMEDEGTMDSTEDRVKMSYATLPYFEQLHRLLTDPPYKPPVKTTLGVLECPVGITRLHVAKLFVTLMATDNEKIYETLVELGTFQTLLDLFFRYVWNNFLHTQVQCCLALAVNCDFKETNDVIYDNVFNRCRLIERILEACDKSDAATTENEKNENQRQGYMGHLINIANNIVNRRESSERLDKFFKDNLSPECLSKWDNFVDTELAKINKIHRILLGGKAEIMTGSSDNPDEYSSYPPEDFLRIQRVEQFYSKYVSQHMTPQFTQNFGFHDEEFNDGDDVLPEEDLDKSEDMFTKICQQKQKADLEDGNAGAEWGADEGELTFQTVVDKRDWPSKQQQHQQRQLRQQQQQQQNDSNSSDDEEDDETLMDVQSFPKLSAERSYLFSGLASIETVADTATATTTRHWDVDPWDVVPSAESVESTGWANFDNFENTLNMENTVIIDNNKICDESKKERESYTESVVDNETTTTTTATVTTTSTTTDTAALESVKIAAVETIGAAGDTKIEDSSIDRSNASPPHVETNVNRSTEIAADAAAAATTDGSSLYGSYIADKNANPNEIIVDHSREIKCEGNNVEKVMVESTETTVQSEIRSSSECENSFSGKRNEIPEAAAAAAAAAELPSTYAK